MTARELLNDLKLLSEFQINFPVLIWVDGAWRKLETFDIDMEVKCIDLVAGDENGR